MKSEDTRNLLLAIALSVMVMAAWQYFYAGPLYQRQHQAQMQANSAAAPASETQPSAHDRFAARRAGRRHAAGAPAATTPETVSAALAASPRVIIDTPSVGGSINLKGGKIDDIVLKDYRETIDPKSRERPTVLAARRARRLLGRDGIRKSDGAKTPNLDTVWTADRQTLTPSQPVTLTWDNGAGLLFKRVIAVDDKYMFTITDSVVNSGAAPRSCSLTRSSCATASRTSPAIRCCTKALSA